nr:hypothetical protein BaRGS_010186 [Batillaria attramentaria]
MARDGGDEFVLATLVMGSFFPAPGSPVHVQYIPIAGIRLQNVAVTDAGIYSVHVNVNLHGSVITEVQTVTVAVSALMEQRRDSLSRKPDISKRSPLSNSA